MREQKRQTKRPTLTPCTFVFKTHLKWLVLNTSVFNHQDTLWSDHSSHLSLWSEALMTTSFLWCNLWSQKNNHFDSSFLWDQNNAWMCSAVSWAVRFQWMWLFHRWNQHRWSAMSLALHLGYMCKWHCVSAWHMSSDHPRRFWETNVNGVLVCPWGFTWIFSPQPCVLRQLHNGKCALSTVKLETEVQTVVMC